MSLVVDASAAVEYLLKAGEDAARTAAFEEALALFREASRVFMARYGDGGDPRKKGRLEKNIGLALLSRGDLSESIAHFDRALEHFGEHVPKTAALSYLSFAADFVAVLGQLYAGLKVSRTVTDWDREREVWQVLFNRGRAEITSDPIRSFRHGRRLPPAEPHRRLAHRPGRRALRVVRQRLLLLRHLVRRRRRALAVAKRLARRTASRTASPAPSWTGRSTTSKAAGRRRRSSPEPLLDDAVERPALGREHVHRAPLRPAASSRDFAGAQASLERLAVLRDE
jgi:tetratricopeptide (TPR) repeat protein